MKYEREQIVTALRESVKARMKSMRLTYRLLGPEMGVSDTTVQDMLYGCGVNRPALAYVGGRLNLDLEPLAGLAIERRMSWLSHEQVGELAQRHMVKPWLLGGAEMRLFVRLHKRYGTRDPARAGRHVTIREAGLSGFCPMRPDVVDERDGSAAKLLTEWMAADCLDDHVRRGRVLMGVSLRDMAPWLGLSHVELGRVERGHVEAPAGFSARVQAVMGCYRPLPAPTKARLFLEVGYE